MAEQTIEQKFSEACEKKAFDKTHRKTIKFNMSRYDAAVVRGKKQYQNLELAKQRAANIKNKAIDNLEKLLIEFESNFIKRGGKVIWAVDAEDAVSEILSIMIKADAKLVVKMKSMTSEELHLNHALEEAHIKPIETDLGEFIVQVAGEKPYHIVTPAMHKSKEDCAKLFHEKFGLEPESSPEVITAYVRKILRENFFNAEVGITGGNFLIADAGAVCMTENEGNGLMSMSFPKIHIAVVGIEKIIPSLMDLDLFWPLLATHGTGQNISVYNSIISGPRQENEVDGPEEMYVILLDNNRTELLGKQEQRRALSCIRCGACLNACPVYKNIGGHSYGVVYSGPIGAVITPHLQGMENYKHLSFASSLCGKCTDVCPAKVPLHKLLLFNRRDSVKMGLAKGAEKLSMFAYKQLMLRRWMIETGGGKLKKYMIKKLFTKPWGDRRTLPNIQPKSFNRLWRENMGIK